VQSQQNLQDDRATPGGDDTDEGVFLELITVA